MNQPRLVETRTRAERVEPALLDRLVSRLQGRGWVPRRVLRVELGISDDKLREIARFSRGEVVGSSALGGYGLVRELPTADVHRVLAETRSRSRELAARAGEIIQVLNNRPREAQPRFKDFGGAA